MAWLFSGAHELQFSAFSFLRAHDRLAAVCITCIFDPVSRCDSSSFSWSPFLCPVFTPITSPRPVVQQPRGCLRGTSWPCCIVSSVYVLSHCSSRFLGEKQGHAAWRYHSAGAFLKKQIHQADLPSRCGNGNAGERKPLFSGGLFLEGAEDLQRVMLLWCCLGCFNPVSVSQPSGSVNARSWVHPHLHPQCTVFSLSNIILCCDCSSPHCVGMGTIRFVIVEIGERKSQPFQLTSPDLCIIGWEVKIKYL